MAISYVGGQVAGRTNASSAVSVNFALTGGSDAAPIADDLVIVTCVTGSAAGNPAMAVATPTGYTPLGQLNQSAVTADTSMNVSYKRMTATPDTAVTIPGTTNNAWGEAYSIQVFRGVDAATPMDVAAVSAGGTGTGRPDPGSISGSTAGFWTVICGGGAAGTGANYTAPANYATDFVTAAGADTTDAMVGSGYNTAPATPENPAAYTGGTTGANDSWTAYTLALRPAIVTTDGVGSSTGASAVAAIGVALFLAVASAAGAGGATGTGQATAASAGSSAAAGAASGVGTGILSSSSSAAGVADAMAVGFAFQSGDGSAAGSAGASAEGGSVAASPAASVGAGVASGIGATTAAAAGESAGQGAAPGIGSATSAAAMASDGASAALGVGAATSVGVASSDGTSTAAAEGSTAGGNEGAGSSVGVATAAGSGAATASSAAEAFGIASIAATGATTSGGVGAASGVASASGVGASTSDTVGSSAGIGSAAGVGYAGGGGSEGAASGTSTASAVGTTWLYGGVLHLDSPSLSTPSGLEVEVLSGPRLASSASAGSTMADEGLD